MCMIRYALAAMTIIGVASMGPAWAGKFNKKVNVGDVAPSYSNLEGSDGNKHSLSDFQDKDVVILAVTCNKCPVAVAYEDRMIAFAKKYAGPNAKAAFVAVSVSNLESNE